MKRHSKSYLEKHPEKRRDDLEATRRACERFRGRQISILNFLEGTRFTDRKHRQQNSPFKHLLRPKTGGIAFVLEAMGDQFHSILDVTIIYPESVVSLWGLLSGRLHQVEVQVREIPIAEGLRRGGYLEDGALRGKFKGWIHEVWTEKDQRIAQAQGGAEAPAGPA